MKILFSLILFASSLSMSCATIFSGSTQMVAVASEPAGAKVYLNNEYKGDTPTSFQVKRKLESYQITLKKEGRPDYKATLENKLNPVAILNLANVFGWGIDALSGAMMKYDSQVSYTLEDPTARPLTAPVAATSVPMSHTAPGQDATVSK